MGHLELIKQGKENIEGFQEIIDFRQQTIVELDNFTKNIKEARFS